MSDQISHTPTPPDLPPPAPSKPVRDTALPELKPKRHAWVWIVVLLVFALIFWWVWHQKIAPAATGGGGRGAAAGGTVTATTATATKGDIGVYLTAIGTVVPVYTDSIVSQVT